MTYYELSYIMQIQITITRKNRGGGNLLSNLKKALDNKHISLAAYAAVLGISQKSAWNKVYEETDLTYPEARKTKVELFPEYDFEYLFASDGNVRETSMDRSG